MTTAADVVAEIEALLPEYRRLVYLTEEVTKPDDFTFVLSQAFYAGETLQSQKYMGVRIKYPGYAKEAWEIRADTYFAALVRFKKKLLAEIESMRKEIS